MSRSINALASDADWEAFISATRDALPREFKVYHSPRPCDVRRAIDHTLLPRPESDESIDELCSEAHYHSLAAVSVSPKYVRRAVQNLDRWPSIAVSCVISYPDGTADTVDKEDETRFAVEQGATEISLVLNRQHLKDRKYTMIYGEIMEVRKAAPPPIKLKVTLETPELNHDEIVAGSIIACVAGADFIQTSTATRDQNPTVETVGLVRTIADTIGKGTKVKASGSFKTADECIQVMKAGADRVTSNESMAILEELGSEELSEQGVGHAMY